MYTATECICSSPNMPTSLRERHAPQRVTRENEFMLLAGKCAMISGAPTEPPRVSRRPHFLREWGHHDKIDIEEIFAGGS